MAAENVRPVMIAIDATQFRRVREVERPSS
jgi:hypothetical protein